MSDQGGVTYTGLGVNISQYNSHYLKWKHPNSSDSWMEVMTPNAPDALGQVNTNTPAPSGCYGYRQIFETPEMKFASVSQGNNVRYPQSNNGVDTRFIYIPWNRMYTKGITTPEQFNARNKHPVKYSVIVEEKQANGNWAIAGESAETCLGLENEVGVQITDWVWRSDHVGSELAKYLNGTIKKDPTLRDLRYRIIVDPDGEWGLARETTRYFYQPEVSTYFTYENYHKGAKSGDLLRQGNYGGLTTASESNAPYARYMQGSPLNIAYDNANNYNRKDRSVIAIGIWLDARQWDSPESAVIEFTFPFHRGASGYQIKLWDTNRVSTYPDYAFVTDDAYGNTAEYAPYLIPDINLQRDRLKAWYVNNVNPNTGVVIVDDTTPNWWRRSTQSSWSSFAFKKHYQGFYNMGNWVSEAPWSGVPRPSKNWSNALHCYAHLPVEYNPAHTYLPYSTYDTGYNYSTYTTAEKAHINAPMLPTNTSSKVDYAYHSEMPRYADASHSTDYNWQRDTMFPTWV